MPEHAGPMQPLKAEAEQAASGHHNCSTACADQPLLWSVPDSTAKVFLMCNVCWQQQTPTHGAQSSTIELIILRLSEQAACEAWPVREVLLQS